MCSEHPQEPLSTLADIHGELMTSPGTPALECSCHPWEKAPLDPTSYENELREAQDGPAQAVCVIPGLVGEQEKGWYSWNN